MTRVLSAEDKVVSARRLMIELSRNLICLGIFLQFFLFSVADIVWAVPACPWGAKVTQPDGTKITIYLRGDEHVHWNESEDGYWIIKNEKSRKWVYMINNAGTAVASKHLVGKVNPKSIGALKPDKVKLAASASFNKTQSTFPQEQTAFTPTTGITYNLVVLVNFSDLAITYARQDYDNLFNEVGYTTDGATGSVKDYFHEISYNALTVQSTVVEAVTLDYGYAYYGANVSGNDIRPREMVQHALAKLQARGFDFSTVDGDEDGWVDGLTIIHAGGGEEYSGNDADYIWSHQWALSSPVTYDGVSMQMYHTEPARRGWDSYPSTQGITRIGVICHETSHFLGLPDLYDYGYDSEGAGNFCLMAGGSWNGSYGTTPAHMSAWCKSSMGWISPTLISSGGAYYLGQVETSTQVYKLQGSFPSTQYFLVENRQGVGFDSGLPGTQRGVLIWHIDQTQPDNDNQTHYLVDLEEASGTQHLELNQNAGEDSDYFRAGNATMFTESSIPNNLSYTSQMLNVNITNVGASGDLILITIGGGPTISSISPKTGTSGTTVNITELAGTMFLEGASVKLIKTGQPDIVATDVNVISSTMITCTFSLVGVATGTWNVKVTNPDGQWAILDNGFNVILPGFTVFLTEDFEASFVNGTPAGWSKLFVSSNVNWVRNNGDHRDNGSHEGSYNALLYKANVANHETYLITPAINFPSETQQATLEFWHMQAYWAPDQDTLKVYYKTSAEGAWSQLASYTTDVPGWTQRTISLPNLSSDYCIGFLGNAKHGYGVCIDDVKISGTVPVPIQMYRLTISSTEGGFTEPNEGSHQYNSGTVVDINAIANIDYHFVNWTGDTNTIADVNSAVTTIIIDANHVIQANFALTEATPEITSMPIISANPNYLYTYDVNAYGIPEPNYVLIVSPAGMDINSTTGLIQWTPDSNEIGDVNVTVEAGNTAGFDRQSFTITVLPSDNSDDNKRSAMWRPLVKDHNNMWAAEDTNRLNIRATGNASNLFAYYTSNGWHFDANKDFAVQIDFHYSSISNYSGRIGIIIGDDANYVLISAGSDGNIPYFYYETVVDGNVVLEKEIRDSNDGTIYIWYDTNSANIYLGHVDSRIENAYLWQTIPNPLQILWNSPVSVDIGGSSTNVILNSGEAYLDNFKITKGKLLGWPPATDLDANGFIGQGDLKIISEYWLGVPTTDPNTRGDFNNDDAVNFIDFAEFGSAW